MNKIISAIILLVLASMSVNAFSANGKQTICHKGKEISVASSAVAGHEKHGDYLGECDGDGQEPGPTPETSVTVVMLRCDAIAGNGVKVVSASSSADIAVILPFPAQDIDCADAIGELLNNGFNLRSITNGNAQSGENDDLHLYTDYLLIGRRTTEN